MSSPAKTTPLLQIKEEFKNLIRPLNEEEQKDLTKSLLSLGCQDTIKTWRSYIVDGHNRYAICSKHNIPFKTEEMSFSDESYAFEMIYINQIGRRNINEYCRGEAVLGLKKIYEERAKAEKLSHLKQFQTVDNQGPTVVQNSGQREGKRNYEAKTDHKLAKKAGVSHDSIHRISKIVDFATEEEKAKLREGTLSINKVYTEKKKEKIRPPDFPTKKYSVIYSRIFRQTYNGQPPYRSFSDIKKLPVKTILEDYAAVFLMVAPRYLEETLDVMKTWGFKYENMLIASPNSCDCELSFDTEYVRNQNNLLLLGTKGEFLPEVVPKFILSRNIHNLLDEMYPGKKKLEIFGRKDIDGWDRYNQEEDK